MSRFFSSKYASLTPYVPGEQPGERKYVKLNTNESPFPPSPKALHWAARHTRSQELYSDPEGVELRAELAKTYGVKPEETILVNGSDEVHVKAAAPTPSQSSGLWTCRMCGTDNDGAFCKACGAKRP